MSKFYRQTIERVRERVHAYIGIYGLYNKGRSIKYLNKIMIKNRGIVKSIRTRRQNEV